MSLYIKMSTHALTDPKLIAAGPDAFWLWVRGLMFAKEHLTDGFVPMTALPLLTLGFRGGKKGIEAAISELTGGEDPLWQKVEGGYTVGEERWANWQTTKAEVEAKREADRVRMGVWRKNKKNKKANEAVTEMSQCDTDDSHNTGHKIVTSTEPEPEPEHRAHSTKLINKNNNVSPAAAGSPRSSIGDPQRAQLIYEAYPRKEGRGAALQAIEKAVVRIQKGEGAIPPIPDVRDACVYLYKRVQTYAQSPAGSQADRTRIPHPATWFNQSRYLDDDTNWQHTHRPFPLSKGEINQRAVDELLAELGAAGADGTRQLEAGNIVILDADDSSQWPF